MRLLKCLALNAILGFTAITFAHPVTEASPTNTSAPTKPFVNETSSLDGPTTLTAPTTTLQARNHHHDNPDGVFYPETKTICLTQTGTHYRAQKFCHTPFTSFWQSHAYFAYKAEFDDYRAANKDRAHDGKFVEKKVCKSFAQKWRVEGCAYGRSEGEFYCCEVRRVRGRDGERNEVGGT
ncbi:hypothetical protein BDV96DRAFT_684038 [Lophiotrema nucula]|uniref:Prokaryotic phospholipase A2-domain-containing protein n=1 Tax=Lophiotrema nucula TaxID=690887 RepID=A0A6A5ZKA6_9PLEO|nr:hypothetical protein BDV96DRAFT_684038 [Lophiotrema nucula]